MSQTELRSFGQSCVKYVGRLFKPSAKSKNAAGVVDIDSDESSSSSLKTRTSKSPEAVLSTTDSIEIIDIVLVKRQFEQEMAMVFELVQ
jgi:hypothetical protein